MIGGVFLYYLPGVACPSLTVDDVRSHRYLADALRDCLRTPATFDQSVVKKHIDQGPDQGRGTLIVARPVPRLRNSWSQLVGFDPENQTWTRAGDYWIGRDNQHQPTPDLLQRDAFVAGYDHALADGQTWTCPTVRRSMVAPCVPRGHGFDPESGHWISAVLPEYREIWERSRIWAARLGVDRWAMTPAEMLDAAALCLGLNYRVSPVEIGLLGLMNDAALDAVLESAIDLPWLKWAAEDPEKKTEVETILADLRNSLFGSAG